MSQKIQKNIEISFNECEYQYTLLFEAEKNTTTEVRITQKKGLESNEKFSSEVVR